MHTEQVALQEKNNELLNAFRERTRAHQQVQKMYQKLKAQMMAYQVADAAGDEVDAAITGRGERTLDKLPGVRTGSGNFSQLGPGRQYRGNGRYQDKVASRSSGSSGQQRGGVGLGHFDPQLQDQGLGSTMNIGSELPNYEFLWPKQWSTDISHRRTTRWDPFPIKKPKKPFTHLGWSPSECLPKPR